MNEVIVVLGNGFDRDFGLDLSFKAYCSYHLCPFCCSDVEYWWDFENKIREDILAWNKNQDIEEAREINLKWQAFMKNFSFFFTSVSDKKGLKIREDSFAYSMLRSFSDNSEVYTFNYTNPYEYVEMGSGKRFHYVHGRCFRDTFNKELMTISQSHNMIVGIDYNRMPQSVRENEWLSPIIKRLNPSYNKTDIEEKLLCAKTVIFFGFSMGITDSDYFDEFFSAIANGTSTCKMIYYITDKRCCFDKFKENICRMGYGYSSIESQVKIILICTMEDIGREDFRTVLSLI